MTEILNALHVAVDPNPIAIGVATFVAVISGIGLMLRQRKQNTRSDVTDKATDKYIDRIEKELAEQKRELQEHRAEMQTLRDDLEVVVQERNALYRLHADIAAEIRILQNEMAAVKAENVRLREQNDAQALQLTFCAKEAADHQAKIRALEGQVRRLQDINEEHETALRSDAGVRAENAANKQEAAAEKQVVAADKMQNAADRFEGKDG